MPRLPGFLPEDLRQLARFVPARGWDAIRWRPLLASLRKVSWRMASGRGVDELSALVSPLVVPVTVGEWPAAALPGAQVESADQRRQLGDDLLRLYFAQWLASDGMFLDLRMPRLALLDDHLWFHPNGLWIELRPDFREGMLALYRSFYSSDEGAFDAALRQMGMLRDGLSAAAEAELKTLLHNHFGIDQRSQRFSIDSFKDSSWYEAVGKEGALLEKKYGFDFPEVVEKTTQPLWQQQTLLCLEDAVCRLESKELRDAAASHLEEEALRVDSPETAAVLRFVSHRIKATHNQPMLYLLDQLGADYFKFAALQLGKESPALALSLMSLAQNLRPDAKFINEQVELLRGRAAGK